MAKVEAQCPAAEIVHPVTSLNPDDAMCRIAGRMQPAEGSPCCGEYQRCKIWRVELDRTRFSRINRSGGNTQVPKTRRARVAAQPVGPSL